MDIHKNNLNVTSPAEQGVRTTEIWGFWMGVNVCNKTFLVKILNDF